MDTHELAAALDEFIQSELEGKNNGLGFHQHNDCPGCKILGRCFDLEAELKRYHRVDN